MFPGLVKFCSWPIEQKYKNNKNKNWDPPWSAGDCKSSEEICQKKIQFHAKRNDVSKSLKTKNKVPVNIWHEVPRKIFLFLEAWKMVVFLARVGQPPQPHRPDPKVRPASYLAVGLILGCTLFILLFIHLSSFHPSPRKSGSSENLSVPHPGRRQGLAADVSGLVVCSILIRQPSEGKGELISAFF